MSKIINTKSPIRFFWLYPKISCLLVALCIFLFLLVFRPFGLSLYNFGDVVILGLIFAFIGSTTIFLSFKAVDTILRNNWTILKELLWLALTFFSIAWLNYGVAFLMSNYSSYWASKPETLEFGESIGYTFALGGLVYLLILTTDEFFKKLFRVKVEHSLTDHTSSTPVQSKTSENVSKPVNAFIELVGRNRVDLLQIDPESIVFIESLGNYLKIVYLDDARAAQLEKTFRSSIHDMCQQLQSYDYLYCCHRSFIVNLKLVDSTIGNSKSKKVVYKLQDRKHEVPVSRLKIQEFESLQAKI